MIALWLTLTTAAAADLDGTWAMENVLVTTSWAPIIGNLKSHSHTWVLLKIDQEGESATVAHQVCGTAVRGTMFKSRVPPAHVAAIPRKTYPAAISEDGTRFVADMGVFDMGLDPACPSLPEDADDPCVRDADGDGQPGATIQIKALVFPWQDVYVAQRNHVILDGKLAEDGWVRGGLKPIVVSVKVLGATNRLFARTPTPPEILLEESLFRMTRIDEGSGCDGVLAALESGRHGQD